MGLYRLRFDISGDVQYSRAFELMEHEARDLSEPLEQIGHDLIQTIGMQFQTEGAYGLGTPWKPLDPAYARWKAEHWPGRPLLVQSGETRAAALDEARTIRVTPQRLVYELASDVAAYHQRGAGHLPQRKIVALSLASRRDWDRILVEFVQSLRRGPLARSVR